MGILRKLKRWKHFNSPGLTPLEKGRCFDCFVRKIFYSSFLAYYGHEVMFHDALDGKEGFVEEKYIDLLQLQKLDFSKGFDTSRLA